MGKDLKGKELGLGISQRKDGLYTARYTDRWGNRKQKYFKKLQECRQWIANAQFDDEHGNPLLGEPTVNVWFDYWIDNVKGGNIRYHTRKNYVDRYKFNIKEYIGDMLLKDVKTVHCQNILNRMEDQYCNTTIDKTRATMKILFSDAVENGLIKKSPMTRSVKCSGGREPVPKNALTVEEQKTILLGAKDSSYFCAYALVLQTGLRVGELAGLRWSDIDFDKRTLRVERTMYRTKDCRWTLGEPKTKTSKRTVPLTDEAIKILRSQKKRLQGIKVVDIRWSDNVFLTRNGLPFNFDVCRDQLNRICGRVNIPVISMHILRHTFATRCIEAGTRPKTLQSILGHSKISTTMDLYVHVTADEQMKELEKVQSILKVV